MYLSHNNIGRLLYLNFTRPDITFSIHHLSQFMQHPTESQWNADVHIVKYLKRSDFFYPNKSDMQVTAFSDADWAKCPLTHRSVLGYCVLFGGALVS
ncbi:hypothetical protein LIER_26385 [Lithospermum erythrorhizon]|uniref:Uncharacterized protein n=1 Tax=Lithospermum erythrorhizon TaxID=34254 RepID=A0AAV3RA91_LITER